MVNVFTKFELLRRSDFQYIEGTGQTDGRGASHNAACYRVGLRNNSIALYIASYAHTR